MLRQSKPAQAAGVPDIGQVKRQVTAIVSRLDTEADGRANTEPRPGMGKLHRDNCLGLRGCTRELAQGRLSLDPALRLDVPGWLSLVVRGERRTFVPSLENASTERVNL